MNYSNYKRFNDNFFTSEIDIALNNENLTISI